MMVEKLLIFSSVFLSLTILLCTIRAIKGPNPADRLIAINVIGTKTVVLISIISFILKESYFLDVVLVYALISFIASIIISNSIETNRRERQ
ncbi:monovalent cation/H+ antiporter complex subunit F [Paramaledivibacter caminithermalis]|uniref:Multisubunit sodium/proton antiporter, MrpF subunit n=1 Tax=Paramaledivibacter caminithermalis (strain DSM 15212 / CIP 107654 / DViRD3) TaxID=1121301 RepID=A0A1M6NZ19_PARC5|nr:monovalent cation/H+ antiporter complex subunit F [Paramaledivibacter caminithermalis]SHK00894.1 multisubunit sodium/proton antiporter, MrpF subunit [Paramaledivibacter caminithermalis DSM 15212]